MSKTAALAIALILKADIKGVESQLKKLDASMTGHLKKWNERGKRLNKIGANATSSGMANIASGVAQAAPLALLAKQAIDLEKNIAGVAKVTNVDFGTKGFAKLKQDAIDVSNQTGVSATNVAELMSELAAGGTAKEQLKDIAVKAAQIGVAFDVAAGEAGQSYMMIKNAMDATDAATSATMDAMNAVTNKYGGKASTLLTFMAKGGASVAKTLKVAGTDMQAFGNAMQNVGISGEEAGTVMKRFQKAVLGNSELKGIFNKAGGGAQGIVAILEKAKKSGDAFSYLQSHNAGEYSSQLALLAMNMDADKGLKSQLAYLGDEKNVKGSAQREYENVMKTTGAQLALLKEQAVNTGTAIGDKLLPHILSLSQKMKPFLEKIAKFIGDNPKLVETVLKIVAASAALKIGFGALQFVFGSFVSPVGKMITGITRSVQLVKNGIKFISAGAAAFKRFYLAMRLASQINNFARGGSMVSKILLNLKTGFLTVGKAIMTAGRFLLANPIILIITAIAVIAFLIIKNWDKIKPWLVKLWSWVTTKTKNAWNSLKKYFSELWEKVKVVFRSAWDFIKQLFLDYHPIGLVIKHWDKISEFFTNLWNGVKETFRKAIDWIVSKFQWLNENVLKPMGSFLGGGDMNVNYSRQPSPQPVPVRAGNNNSITYNPVIQVSGSVDARTAQLLSAQMRKDFAKQMQDYNHQQERSRLG